MEIIRLNLGQIAVKHIDGVIRAQVRDISFSRVNMADFIVVLDNGYIAVTGSHQDLMTKKGEYAALYKTQATPYSYWSYVKETIYVKQY